MNQPILPGHPRKAAKAMSRAQVVALLRQEIHAHELVPGQRLVESDLCERLGVTRTTARAALTELSNEGLVERVANRGARVRTVGLKEALHIAEVRLAVESVSVARAAERITAAEIAQLRDLGRQLADCAQDHDLTGYAEATNRIREVYVAVADQPVARDMLDRLRARMIGHQFKLTYRPGRAQVTLPLWLDLVDAICRRDPAGAGQALRRHVDNVCDAMIVMASEAPPLGLPPARCADRTPSLTV